MSKQTKSENQIIYICDFRRYEKSSSKKRPAWKGIDFDDFVFCTTESKSIPFHAGLFLEDDFS